jgi:predicted CoA-binding protein
VRVDDDTIRQVLSMRRWAVVGAHPDRSKPAGYVPAFLQQHGYEVVPVTPVADEVLGEPAYPALADVPGEIDVVDLFRRSAVVGAHVDEAIAVGAKAVWLQVGVIDEAAAERARDAGLLVVMDRCPKVELPRLGVSGPGPVAPVG